MASEPEESVSSLIQRLMAMPFLSRRDSDSDHQDPSLDRIILINPVTQGMVVIRGNGMGFDYLLNDMMKKEGQAPASQASIDAMPILEIKGTEDIGCECVICLEEWKVGDLAKEMPCKHKFHGGCVEKWLKVHGSCPVCRYEMPIDGDKRGRQVWVTFSFGNGRSSSSSTSESDENQESRVGF